MIGLIAKHVLRNKLVVLLGACILIFGSGPMMAQQARAQAYGRQQTGEIQSMSQSRQEIVIGGETIAYDPGRIRVFYLGKEVDKYILNPGMTVRYNRDREGYIRDIHLVAPRDIIEHLLVR